MYLQQVDRAPALLAALLLHGLIVLPLLPANNYGPFSAFNPYKVWKYVVLIAAISFTGYLAVKVLGSKRGVGITGLFGGLASSTGSTGSTNAPACPCRLPAKAGPGAACATRMATKSGCMPKI